MENILVEENDIDSAFIRWFELMKTENKEVKESRDGEVVAEVLNAITVIHDPTRCIMKNKIRKMPIRYAIGEMLWYLSGNPSLKGIQNYTQAWDRMSDNGLTVNSNYGYCIMEKFGFNQLEEIEEELRKNQDTRRAVLHIKYPYKGELNSNDVNCTVYLQFFIRDGKLILHTHMRSNDLWMGFPYDIFQFTCLQIMMAMKLNLEIGDYVHIADSLHMYKRDYEVALENERDIK